MQIISNVGQGYGQLCKDIKRSVTKEEKGGIIDSKTRCKE